MRKTLAALAIALTFQLTIALTVAIGIAAPAPAQPGGEPSGAVALPDGPAQAWLLADLDSGRILASRNPYEAHPPASTIKALLAIVVLDQLPLNAAIMANPAAVDVECSCAGIKAGRPYTVRQLLDVLMLVSGNDAANVLADGIGGYRAAIAKMNAKAAALG
ncbi:MAG TPA: serine hydrolase, partial [Mycobacterium sp.]|nr:serine hydrolase [Mycobacterium sp.]